jgi:carbon-monoxide dehydrogenase large subunit
VATAALIRTFELPPEVAPGLDAGATYQPPHLDDVPDADGKINAASTFSNCAHACVVAVDTGTGVAELLHYVVVNDSGTVINPLLAAGQLHGGVAQGIGCALLEELRFDDGVPVATTFMDYLVPTAAEIPTIAVTMIETPAPDIPLGVKGIGEAGIIGPPPVVAQAVDDALSGTGAARFLVTPITPARILDALAGARAA